MKRKEVLSISIVFLKIKNTIQDELSIFIFGWTVPLNLIVSYVEVTNGHKSVLI